MLTTIFRIAAWGCLLAIAAVTVLPIYLRPRTAAPADFERFMAFAVFGAMWALAYPRQLVPIAIGLVVVAGLLEFAQELQPSRHARWENGMLKAIGAIVGFVFAHGVRMLGNLIRPAGT